MSALRILALFLCVQGVFAQKQTLDKIIGKVDNYFILKSDLEATMAQYVGRNDAPSQCQLLENLFINKLLLAKTDIDSITVEDKQVNNELTGRMEEMVRRFGSEKNIIEAYGKPLESLKGELRQQVREQLLTNKMRQKLQEKATITPNEVKRFFNTIPRDSLPLLPTEVEVGHIVRLAKVTREEKGRLKERLVELKKRVQKGEDFSVLAKEFSEDLGSGQQGGDLGWAKRGMMVGPFEAACMQMKPNEISEIIETDYGLHLIQLLERRGQEYHARHILLRPDYNRLDVSNATAYLDSIRVQLLTNDTAKFDKMAKVHSEDTFTKDAGGMLLNGETRGTKQPFDGSMETYLYMTLDTMKVGTFSKPAPYRTEDGKTGVRVIWYKAKYPPHIANLKDDYPKLASFALNQKKSQQIDKWFRQAKQEVFIYIDDEYKDCHILEDLDRKQ